MDLVNRLLHRGAPEALALIDERGDQLSYKSLITRVYRAASDFSKSLAGVPGRGVVGIATGVPSQDLIALLGLLFANVDVSEARAGSPRALDARGEPARASDAHLAALITSLDQPPEVFETSARCAPRTAIVLHTSGSSGKPREVMLSARGILANIEMILSYLPIREHRVTGVEVPLHHAYGLIGQCFTTLAAGGTIVMLAHHRFLPARADAMRRHGVNGFSSVPTSLSRWADFLEEIRPEERPQFGYLASAGERLPTALAARWSELYPGIPFYNQYGMTEASPRVSMIEVTDPRFAAGSIGKPLEGIEAVVLDPTTREAIPQGEVGELLVRTPSRMLGYLGKDDISMADADADRLLPTGDLASVDEGGYLFLRGRLDDLVKIAGEKVSLVAIAEQCATVEGVGRCVFVAGRDEHGAAVLVGFHDGSPFPVESDCKKVVRENLGSASVPHRLFWLDAFPTLESGKVDRHALERMATERLRK